MSHHTAKQPSGQGPGAKKTASHRASSVREALAGMTLDTIAGIPRSYEALYVELVKTGCTLTRGLLNRAIDDLKRAGQVEIERIPGVGLTIHPVKKIPAGKRAGSSKKEAAR